MKTENNKNIVFIDRGRVRTELDVVSWAKEVQDLGAGEIILTDIDRDGAMQGLNIDATIELSLTTSIPVIASGGVASIEDLQLLKARGSENIEGVICGRALYNGAIDLKEGLKILNS